MAVYPPYRTTIGSMHSVPRIFERQIASYDGPLSEEGFENLFAEIVVESRA